MSARLDTDGRSFTDRVVHGLGWAYAAAVLDALLHLIVISVLAHLLTPSDFGVMSIALIFLSFAERIGQVGVGQALVQRPELSDDDLATGFSLSLISGTVIAAAISLCAAPIAEFFAEPQLVPVLRLLAWVFVLDGFGVVSQSMLQRRLKIREISLVENGAYLFGNGVVGVALALAGWGVWALVYSTLVSRIFKSLGFMFFGPVPLRLRLHRRSAASILYLGLGFSLGRLLNFGALQGDNLVVGKLLGSTALGMYSRSYQLMTLPANYLMQIIDKVLFPALAIKQREVETLRTVFISGIELVCLLALPFSVFMYVTAADVILVLFGPQWGEAVPVLQILSLGIFFRTAYKCADTLIRARGAVYHYAAVQVIYSALVISGALIGSRFGLAGASAAVCLAVAANYWLLSRIAMRSLGVTYGEFFRAHLGGIWISLALAVGLSLCEPLISVIGGQLALVRLGLMGVLAAAIGVTFLVFAPDQCRMRSIPWLLERFSAKSPRIGRLAAVFSSKSRERPAAAAAGAETPD